MLPHRLEEIEFASDVEKLMVLRKRLGLKQYEFAKMVGISTNYLVAVENYRQPFSRKLKKKVDDYLKRVEMEHIIHAENSTCLFR
ncbi:helix-turn-helix transcriptional regulator [Sutcliffiella sp. NPDC057660]|uniref:helix-turn-helix transcriptional regulator n=1 Tax=Sutcliffiella sp. NPDC057660 TaxID=3346199 RepID=UPI0036C580C3